MSELLFVASYTSTWEKPHGSEKSELISILASFCFFPKQMQRKLRVEKNSNAGRNIYTML